MTGPEAKHLLFTRRNIITEIWSNLPVWFFYLQGLILLLFTMALVQQHQFIEVGISRHIFAVTAFPVLIWSYAYFRQRLMESPSSLDKNRLSRLLWLGVFGIPLVIWLFFSIFPFFRLELRPSTLRYLFERMQIVWILLMVAHVWRCRGFQFLVTFFVVGLFYGLALENSGIIMGYFFEPNYTWYLGRLPAPISTMMGWCLIFYCCITLTEYFRERSPRLQNSPLWSGLFTTVLALSFDAQLDPLASLPNMYWQWNELLPTWWLNVPFCNYAAWFGAFLSFSWVYFAFRDRADLNWWQKNRQMFLYVPMIAALAGFLWLVLMIIYEGGISGPTFQIINAYVEKLVPYPT